MSTSVSSVASHFPDAENGFTTTASGPVSSGAGTVGLNSTAGYTNGEPVVFIIDPANSKKQTFTGIIDTSGNQVTGVVWTAGTNVAHDTGATIVDYATATHVAMISKGIKVAHNQDGTHKTSLVLVTPKVDTINEKTAANGVTIDSLNIKDGALNTNASVIPNNLIASTGTSWAWQTWTPTFVSWTIGTGGSAGTTARYIQIGKTVFFYIHSTLGTSGQSVGTDATFSLPVTAASGQIGLPLTASGFFFDSGASNYDGTCWLNSTTTSLLLCKVASATFTTLAGTTSTQPITWAAGDSFLMSGCYEAV